MDASGRLSDSPFASEGFAGAVGVEVLPAGATAPQKLLVGLQASGWATFDALPIRVRWEPRCPTRCTRAE
jgi:hypothetical protein